MRKNILNSPRLLEFKKHKRKIFFGKVTLYVFLFLVIIVGLAYLSHVSALNISSIEISGNKVIDAEIIKNSVEESLSGNYLYVLSKKNILLYSKNNIKKELLKKFNRIKDANFSLKDKKILEVFVTERTALYTWCGIDFETDLGAKLPNPEKCYFMDEGGFVFDEAPFFSGEVYFKFFGLINLDNETPLGSYFLPDIFPKIVYLKKALEDMKLRPVALYAQEDGNIKIFLSGAISSIRPEIIFHSKSDFQKIVENLGTALNTEPLKSNFRDEYSSLLYIDLRFGNRVYYKFK